MTQEQILNILAVGQIWQSNRTGEQFTIASIALDKWNGFCVANFTDGSWVNIHSLVANATQVATRV